MEYFQRTFDMRCLMKFFKAAINASYDFLTRGETIMRLLEKAETCAVAGGDGVDPIVLGTALGELWAAYSAQYPNSSLLVRSVGFLLTAPAQAVIRAGAAGTAVGYFLYNFAGLDSASAWYLDGIFQPGSEWGGGGGSNDTQSKIISDYDNWIESVPTII